METLYDLLGALPKDGADDLRAAFRRAVSRAVKRAAHPDVNEILGDAELREAYDHLLAVARVEQEQAAKHALADKVHKLASGVTALAGVLEEFEAEWGQAHLALIAASGLRHRDHGKATSERAQTGAAASARTPRRSC